MKPLSWQRGVVVMILVAKSGRGQGVHGGETPRWVLGGARRPGVTRKAGAWVGSHFGG